MSPKDALEAALIAGRLTKEDAASKAGLSMSTVQNVLTGKHYPSRLTIDALRKIPGFSERHDVATVC